MDTLEAFFYKLIFHLPSSSNPLSIIERTLQEMGFDILMTADERIAFLCLYSSATVITIYKEDPDLKIIISKIISQLMDKYPSELCHLIEFFGNRNY